MAHVLVSINGVEPKQPIELKMSIFDLTKSGRVASGKMTIEIIAQKRKFSLLWPVISSTEKIRIMDQVASPTQAFHTLVYLEDNIEKSAIVYAGAKHYEVFRHDGYQWYWKNFQFDLIEQ